MKNENKPSDQLTFEISDKTYAIPINDIVLLETKNLGTKIHLENGEHKYFDKPLTFFSHLLISNFLFFQSHHSCLLNFMHIEKYSRNYKGYIVMINNTKALLDKDKMDDFMAITKKLFHL